MQRLSSALADRYVIDRELGAGGMATVYLAHDVRHDRRVALKVLRPELSAILGAERFLHEIKTTANLQHPHILSLFDSGEADGLVYYVMPYVEGESLRDRLSREKQLPVEDAVRIAREVADALQYAHEHGIVHRDIKPENILLHGGHAMVADFGIALAASRSDGGSRMTETGMSLGTPHYMSPEQAMGEREITPKADIYALGCVLYEMLTAEPPFMGATAQAIIARVMTEEPRSLTMQRKSIPPHIEAAVERALEKLPADRWASAAEFGAALADTGYRIPGTGAGKQHTALPTYRRAALPWALAFAALAAAAWGWLRPAPSPDVVRYILGLPDSQAMVDISDRRLAISPDGRAIVYVGQAATGTRLWYRRRDALVALPLPGTEGASNPAFSPDGGRIAFISGTPRALRVVSLNGGTAAVLTDSLVDRGGVSWGYDGYIYYDGHLTGDGVARIRETGGRPEVASTPRRDSGETYHNLPVALPSGKGILFAIRRPGAGTVFDVGALAARTGTYTVLVHGAVPVALASGRLLYLTSDGALMAVPFDQGRLRMTGEPVEVASGVAVRGNGRGDVAISSSGTLVYAAGAAGSGLAELVWVTRAGAATVVDSAWRGEFLRPVLSPNGRQVAVGIGRDIWVKPLDGGPASKITFDGRYAGPAWLPDGRRVAFNSTGPRPQVFVAPADGSALPAPFPADSAGSNNISFSRDGAWLVYGQGNDLFAMRTRGDSARRDLVVSPFNDNAAALSPDGRWLAYMSDESGGYEVYVRPFPDTRTAKRQVSIGGGIFPRWAPNGRELFYQRLSGERDLVAAPVLPGPAFAVGEQRALFSLSGYIGNAFALPAFDVSPDGQRFLMVRRVGATMHPDELIVVENFFEVLAGRAAR